MKNIVDKGVSLIKRKPFLKSIMSRLVLLYLALVFIVMIICGTFIYISIKTQEASKAETELRSYAKIIEENVLLLTNDPGTIMDLLNSDISLFVSRDEIQVAILTSAGVTIAPSNEMVFTDTVILSAMDGAEKFVAWKRGIDNQGRVNVMMNYAAPATGLNGESYIVFLSMNASDIMENFSVITNIIIIAVFIAMVLAVVLGILFSRTLTEPISSLTKTAREMAQGNLEQEIRVNSDDEIGQLTESFNNMAKSLDKTLSDMQSEKNRIEIILNNMTDGVLAYDRQSNLVHANYACLEMLGVKDIEDLGFHRVMKILGLDYEKMEDFNQVQEDDSTISIDDKYISFSYNTYTNQFGATEGVVVVLQDVTKHTKLDNMRKEFVANVSHEIRTPLTTIKSYTETLLDGALSDQALSENFLGVIINETDRMTLLASDLLELSRFDNNQLKMNMEDSDLVSIIKNSIRQNSVIAQQNGQTIDFSVKEEEMPLVCDPARINQVLNNVISNAIKYSGAGAKVSISADGHGKYYRVYIKDEGVGVPKEDLKRIFERFYRVDKARSRAMGGTGLGLAIAKEIMDAHQGKISAISGQGEGTTMILRFNKPQ